MTQRMFALVMVANTCLALNLLVTRASAASPEGKAAFEAVLTCVAVHQSDNFHFWQCARFALFNSKIDRD